jgi:hypothetical protein
MSQPHPPLKSHPSRREQFRAALIMVEIAVLLLAIVARNLQPPPLRDVVVYVEREVVFAASLDQAWSMALMPLYKGCTLHWNDGTGEHSASVRDMSIPLYTGDWLSSNSQVAFSFQARTLDYLPGHPNMTLTLDNGEIRLWSECPPEPVKMAVYVQANALVMVDTTTGAATPLMPLRSDLLWSSTTSVYMTVAQIAAWMPEPEAAWLPDGAELVGTFSTTTPVEVLTLDTHHVMLRTSGEDIVLLSF